MPDYSTATQTTLTHIDKFLDEMIAIRHDIHAHPELSYEEHRTASIVEKQLKAWGYEVETGIGGTGVVGRLKVGTGTKSLGIRADMDALPLQEHTDLPYKSQYDGKMHACGHDGHTAILLTAARYLAETKNFNGTLNLVFQPAEERGEGARAMVEDGLFERFPMDAIFGLHNLPDGPLGVVATRTGSFLASVDEFEIIIRGKGGHGASPNETIDPIVVGAAVVQAIQSIISRNLSPAESGVITIGSFQSGFAPNIIPVEAKLLVTVRSHSHDNRALLVQRLHDLVQQQAKSFGAEAIFTNLGACPPVVNNPAETEFALKIAEESFGANGVNRDVGLVFGSEDFSYFLEKCPGCYVMIGNGPCATIHSPQFNFNDGLLRIGGAYWSRLAEEFLR